MRALVPFGLAVLLLAGCEPPIPDSRPGGVGFESYSDYQRRHLAEADAARAAGQTVQGPVQNQMVPFPSSAGSYAGNTLPAGTGTPTASDLAQAGIGVPAGSAPMVPGAVPLLESPEIPAGVPPANPAVTNAPGFYPPGATPDDPVASHAGISDENDFQAVSSRETIESDKARMDQNRAAYQQIQPTANPERTGASEAAVDLVQYALKAPNRMGEAIYPRSKIALANSQKACARHASPEAAQQAFLASGGPKRDPKNLDPDGDGFACYWDPTPFQNVKN
jgi:hypothetical protein